MQSKVLVAHFVEVPQGAAEFAEFPSVIYNASMSSASPEEGKKENGDLPYHLHRLFGSNEAGVDERVMAARAILRATKRRIEDALPDDLLPKFLAAYEGSNDLGLRCELAGILSNRWSTREEVQQLLRCSIDAPDTPPQVLESFVSWLQCRLEDAPALSQDQGIRKIVASAHKLLARGDGEPKSVLAIRVATLLKTWGLAAYAHERGLEKVDTDLAMQAHIACHDADSEEFRALSRHLRSLVVGEQLESWIDGLEHVFLTHRKSDALLAWNAMETQSFLRGISIESILSEFREMNPEDEEEDDVGVYTDDANLLDLLFPPKPPTLTSKEEDRLAELIHAQPHSPASLLTEIIREKHYIFLDVCTNEASRMLPDIVRELEKEAHLSHVALNIPPQNAGEFHRFLAGENTPGLQHALYGGYEFADLEYKDMAEIYRNVLREIDAIEGVEWAFVGAPQCINVAGELALDQHARRLAQIRKIYPQAKILVLNEGLTDFHEPMSRINLTHADNGSKRFSLPRRLADDIGEGRIACIMALGTKDRFDMQLPGNDEIGEFCRKHGIVASFGVRIANTPLANKPFNRETYRNTYGEAWDGLIVFVPNDDGGGKERTAEPETSLGKALSPQKVPA